jgi:hypothetical protein
MFGVVIAMCKGKHNIIISCVWCGYCMVWSHTCSSAIGSVTPYNGCGALPHKGGPIVGASFPFTGEETSRAVLALTMHLCFRCL